MKSITIFMLSFLLAREADSQTPSHPLSPLEAYIGIWVASSDQPMAKDQRMKHLQVIDFEWGANKKLIRSKTGIHSKDYDIPFSEGTITYNPNTKKIVWLEYQYDGDLLFEGEYIPLENGGLQRIYTVHYAKDYKSIPNPEEGGWARLYKETFTLIGKDTIDWKTETFIKNQWIMAGSPNGFKAVKISKKP